MNLSSLFFTLIFAPLAVFSLVVPNADTPSFYLVAVSQGSPNLVPLRIGSDGVFASLAGIGSAPLENYFYQGLLTSSLGNSGQPPYRPFINTGFSPTGGCATFGQFGFLQNDDTNKCVSYVSFQIQSDQENSQLGAKLVFNYVGGFYSCGPSQDVWYKVNPSDGPAGCTAIDLYTVPVV